MGGTPGPVSYSNSGSGPRLLSVVIEKKKYIRPQPAKAKYPILRFFWLRSDIVFFLSNTMSSGKHQIRKPQATRRLRTRDGAFTPSPMGKSMVPRPGIHLRVGVILFSAHNHPSHCYIRTQPFINVMAAVGTFMAAYLSALAGARDHAAWPAN